MVSHPYDFHYNHRKSLSSSSLASAWHLYLLRVWARLSEVPTAISITQVGLAVPAPSHPQCRRPQLQHWTSDKKNPYPSRYHHCCGIILAGMGRNSQRVDGNERYYDLNTIIHASVVLGFLPASGSRVGIYVVSWTSNFGLA